MGSPNSSPSPSPAPSPITSSWFLVSFFKLLFSKSPKGELLRIEICVAITVILLLLLFFLGWMRRSVRFGWFLKYLTKIIYVLIPVSITYIMGLMHNASTFHLMYPFWACILVYAYGGVATITACEFSDNEAALRYFWHTLPLLFWTGWLGVLLYNQYTQAYKKASSVFLLTVFLGLAIMNTRDTLKAFFKASKSKGLPSEVHQTVRYMREGRDVPAGEGPLPLVNKYLVWGNPYSGESYITIDLMWMLIYYCFPIESAGKKRLSELSLSYAFFKLILRRFADFPLYESSEPRTRRFIREELLAMDVESVFHIIEVELQYLFDFFYTKSHISSERNFGHRLYFIGLHCLYAFVVFPLWISNENKDRTRHFSIQFYGHSLEVGVTATVMIIFLLLEFWKFFNALFSNQSMVWLTFEVAIEKVSQEEFTQDGFRVKMIKRIWNIKDWFSGIYLSHLFKPWQRQLGQYSFLESYSQVPKLAHFSWFGNFVKVPRIGQTGESSVELSTGVKQAIVTSLLQLLPKNPNDRQTVRLSRGRATIARYRLSVKISHTFLLETDTHAILVWHIATSLCARSHPLKSNDQDFLIADQLSKYCAYLVTFSPELLPVHPFTTECLFDEAVKQAKNVGLINFNPLEEVAIKQAVKQADVAILVNDDAHSDEVVAMGKELATKLMEEAINPNPENGWKFLAEFWAELLLYLAPSDNVTTHGECLAKGGEFITHLWALLTHAGVVNRSKNCSPSAGPRSRSKGSLTMAPYLGRSSTAPYRVGL